MPPVSEVRTAQLKLSPSGPRSRSVYVIPTRRIKLTSPMPNSEADTRINSNEDLGRPGDDHHAPNSNAENNNAPKPNSCRRLSPDIKFWPRSGLVPNPYNTIAITKILKKLPFNAKTYMFSRGLTGFRLDERLFIKSSVFILPPLLLYLGVP
ncbi:hypothetical protein D3C72_1439380 [compost metagenome]